jgi:predicted patatin/cPLA2 family phospholipase
VPIGIGRTEKNPDELKRAYQMGRKEAELVLPHLKVFLS